MAFSLGGLLGGVGNFAKSALGGLFGAGGGGGGQSQYPTIPYGTSSSVPMGGQVGYGYNVGGTNAMGNPMSFGKAMTPAIGQVAGQAGQSGFNKFMSNPLAKLGVGAAGMGISQMFSNPQAPKMPDSYKQTLPFRCPHNL